MKIKSFDRCFPRSDGNSDNVNSIVHYIDGINMSPRMTLNDVIFRIGVNQRFLQKVSKGRSQGRVFPFCQSQLEKNSGTGVGKGISN